MMYPALTEASYDVYISHAYEDNSAYSKELALALKKKGLKVWYSGFELEPGESIADSVSSALKEATLGLIIISPVYLQRPWAMSELKSLFSQESGKPKLLVILHGVTFEEIRYQLPLEESDCLVSPEMSMTAVVNKVLRAVRRKGKTKPEKAKDSSKKRQKKKLLSEEEPLPTPGFIAVGGFGLFTNAGYDEGQV